MDGKITVFKSPSQIIFKVRPTEPTPIVTVAEAKRGYTFLHRDAICMLTEVSAYQALNEQPRLLTQVARDRFEELLKDSIFITNLQTGRTYAVRPTDEIKWIKVTMTVEGK